MEGRPLNLRRLGVKGWGRKGFGRGRSRSRGRSRGRIGRGSEDDLHISNGGGRWGGSFHAFLIFLFFLFLLLQLSPSGSSENGRDHVLMCSHYISLTHKHKKSWSKEMDDFEM